MTTSSEMAMGRGGVTILATILTPILLMGEALGSRRYVKTGNGFEVNEGFLNERNIEMV